MRNLPSAPQEALPFCSGIKGFLVNLLHFRYSTHFWQLEQMRASVDINADGRRQTLRLKEETTLQ